MYVCIFVYMFICIYVYMYKEFKLDFEASNQTKSNQEYAIKALTALKKHLFAVNPHQEGG